MSFQAKECLIEKIDETLHHHLPQYRAHFPVVHVLEAEFSLYHLKMILQSSHPTQTQGALVNFLKSRWNYLRDTNLQYVHDFHNPANQVCIMMAGILHDLTGVSSLGLLMPSLRQVKPESYVTSSYQDEELDLRHLILSDDNSRLIHVVDTLDFAINDGILKHTAVMQRKSNHLSATETERLLSRHPSVKDVYEAIDTKVQFELHGETLGSHLKRLIIGLEEGNVDHHGSETDAGEEANLAITEFASMLEGLSPEKRELLMNASKLFETHSVLRTDEYTVKDAWRRLQRRDRFAFNVGMTCVKIIGGDLNDILSNHPELYRIPLFDTPELGVSLDALSEQVTVLRQSMMVSLTDLEFHPAYEMQNSNKLLRYLCEKLFKNPDFTLHPSYIAWVFEISKHTTDESINRNCTAILRHVATHYAENIIQQAHQRLTGEMADAFERMLLRKRTLTPVASLNEHALFKKAKPEPKAVLAPLEMSSSL